MTDERKKEESNVIAKTVILIVQTVKYDYEARKAIAAYACKLLKSYERLAKIEVLEDLLKGCHEGCGSVRTLYINEVIDKLKDGK